MDILKTKLHPPRAQGAVVQRLDLIESLNLGRTKKVTLVCAPAGYGKSLLVSEWLKDSQDLSAWFSLDEEDNDLRCFLKYLSAALQNILPEDHLKTEAMSEALELPAVPTLVANIIDDLERTPKPICLVLDDFQLIHSRTIHKLVDLLLKHLPEHLHLVLISRVVPPLALPGLRAQNKINEIQLEDLSFSPQEVKSFLENGLKQSVDLQMAEHWYEQTEGWVAGLQLALYAIQNKSKSTFKPVDHPWNSDYVEQYLFSEVLAQQSPIERSLLEDISILDRFEPSLCDHVRSAFQSECSSVQAGRDMVNSLVARNLFVIPLDESQQWFRFHHLFKDLLLKELRKHRSPEMIALLHARASEWLEDNNYINEALDHKLKANDIDGAVQLVEKERNALLNQHQHHILSKWLALFTLETIDQRQELLMLQAWVYYFDGRYQLISPLLEKIESMTGELDENAVLYGEISLLRGAIYYWCGEGKVSLDFIERSLTLIPQTLHFARGLAELYLSLAGLMAGEKTRVFKALYEQLQYKDPHPLRRLRLQMGLIFGHLLAGELLDLLSLGRQYLQLLSDWNIPNLRAQAFYAMGRAHYQRNELDSAISYFLQADEIGYNLTQNVHTDVLAALAISYQAAGDHDNALHQLDRLLDYVSSHSDPNPLKIVDSCRAHIELIAHGVTQWRGLKDKSSKAEAGLPVWSNAVLWIESPTITECRAFNASNRHEELILAEQKLRQLLDWCISHHNVEQQIELGALYAVVLQKLEQTDEANLTLENAVKLAETGGYIRPFLEMGPPMVEMLKQLSSNETCTDECNRLLATFDDQHILSEHSHGQAEQPIDWRQILSSREYEVLLCIVQRMHNQQIADALYVSKETVRYHLKNIYRKLEVSKRNDAVLKAKRLGLFKNKSSF